MGSASRVQLDRLGGEVLELGESLDPGVAGADEHEAQVFGPARRVFQRLGDVHAIEHLVAHGGRIGQRLEADRMLGKARDGQRA